MKNEMNFGDSAVCRKRKLSVLLACLVFAGFVLLPIQVNAGETMKVVRVGWYESPFNMKDRFDRRSGYAYEYQQKIAAYVGWSYEYVEGSWPVLLQKLVDGEIDLLSDVSFTPDRAEKILYSSLPMGAEEYYIFTVPDNTEILPEDPRTLDGKRIGVDKEFDREQKLISSQAQNQWEKVSVSSGIAEYDPKLDQSLKDLISRADQLMYENKRLKKENRQK